MFYDECLMKRTHTCIVSLKHQPSSLIDDPQSMHDHCITDRWIGIIRSFRYTCTPKMGIKASVQARSIDEVYPGDYTDMTTFSPEVTFFIDVRA